MNLRDLEYLVALADAGSFRKAAIAAGVSQPTLSTQVKKLEQELGVVLVERGGTPVQLTPAGVEVVGRARAMLVDAAALRQAAAAHRDPDGGTLRLGAFPTLGPYLLSHVVPGVRAAFPDLTLLLTEAKSASLLRMLDAGELDAVLVAADDAGPDRGSLPLFREEFLLAAPQGHPLARAEEPVTMADMRGVEVIVMSAGHCMAEQVNGWVTQVDATCRQDYRATSVESLRSTVGAGSSVTLLPALAVAPPVVPNAALVIRPLTDPVPSRDIALVWRRNSAQEPLLRRVAPLLVPQLGGESAAWIKPLVPTGGQAQAVGPEDPAT